MTTRRIFAAIDIGPAARQHVAAYMHLLADNFLDRRVRWERVDKLHITIDFAGYLDDADLTAYLATAQKAASAAAPFLITIAGTGEFIKRQHGVLWLGLRTEQAADGARPLSRLAAYFKPEMKNYKPHLTIARLKEPGELDEIRTRHKMARFEEVAFAASELTVYESQLLPTGSVYSVMARYPFETTP